MKKIVITGSGSGLGKALALRYANAGTEICIADVNADAGNEVAKLILQQGGAAFFISCDTTQQGDVNRLIVALNERWSSIDMLINNAGIATAGSLASESLEQWQWVIDVNVLGQVRMTKAMLPLLRTSQAPERDMINIASQAGITSAPSMGSYCVTKAAMVAYSETAHLELADEGIHVSVVCPAFFDTNLNKSLLSADPKMQSLVNKLIKKSGVSAEHIAGIVFDQVAKRKFMIVTHKSGRQAYRWKRYLPIERYLSIVKSAWQSIKHSTKSRHMNFISIDQPWFISMGQPVTNHILLCWSVQINSNFAHT